MNVPSNSAKNSLRRGRFLKLNAPAIFCQTYTSQSLQQRTALTQQQAQLAESARDEDLGTERERERRRELLSDGWVTAAAYWARTPKKQNTVFVQ